MKEILCNFFLTRGLYQYLKEVRDRYVLRSKTKCRYKFCDRSKNRTKLCIVLSGYKPFLYESVFGRLCKYSDNDIDVCIITSGLYSVEVDKICELNQWSYLSTRENNVSLVQNLAISLHRDAEYIFKLDEDIFITKDYFKNLYNAYLEIEKNSNYIPGFVAPLIPINGFGHLRVLKKLGLEEKYTELFEKPKYAAGIDRMIENNPSAAKFFWGEGGYVPTIDELNLRFSKEEFSYSVCPMRFSIGAILFRRDTFFNMGMFNVKRGETAMGADEAEWCSYCICNSKAIIVVENVVIGHLSFGPQNSEMKNYYLSHKDLFLA